jgi:CRP/FNR family transcriptional regulator, cyclic AMP receptor protein
MVSIDVRAFADRFPAFASALAADELDKLLHILKIQEFEASEALIAENTMSDSLFFVWDGELDVLMDTLDGEHKVAQLGVGTLFGEISVLSPGPATATIRSEQGCTALHLTRSSLEKFWQEHPSTAAVFIQELSKIIARRIRAANEELDQLLASGDHRADALLAVHKKLLKEAD